MPLFETTLFTEGKIHEDSTSLIPQKVLELVVFLFGISRYKEAKNNPSEALRSLYRERRRITSSFGFDLNQRIFRMIFDLFLILSYGWLDRKPEFVHIEGR